MTKKYGPADKYIFEKEAEEIGGTSVFHYGQPGTAKTSALWQTAKIDVENNRAPLWRGQDTCQWIGLAAQKLPVTLWIHDTVKEYEFYLTGDRSQNIEKKFVELEEMNGVDMEVKRFKDFSEIIENMELDRANVYFVPGDKSEKTEDRYFFYDMHRQLFKTLNTRSYGDHITWYCDEVEDVLPDETKQPFYQLIYFIMPKHFGNLRKNNTSAKMAGHDPSGVFYKFRDKSNAVVYHGGAKVKHPQVSQRIVNNLGRGEVVIAGYGYEKATFNMPFMPFETIPWISESNSVKLRMSYEADIPNVVPDEAVDDDTDQSVQQVKRDTKVSICRKIYRDDSVDVTQRQLAAVFDVSRTTIQDWLAT